MIHQSVKGNIVDIPNRTIYPGCIYIENDIIKHIEHLKAEEVPDQYILPGFIDAHIHIESSMLVPSEFSVIAVQHGTVATISDPHEIANVCGIEGVQYMIDNGNEVPLKFHFGAPSCVPATPFETAGAVINSEDILKILAKDDIYYLAEMMNFPGVLMGNEDVLQKINYAKQIGKPIDGHAPGLRGDAAAQYIQSGITTDHECTTLEEAEEKISLGMKILIREGSAAKNYSALHSLLASYPAHIMFCSDDKHPDELIKGHINLLVKRALSDGYNLFDVLYAACIHPILHYKMSVGYLKIGQPADFIIVDNFERLNVLNTFINGAEVYANGKVNFERVALKKINNFKRQQIQLDQLVYKCKEDINQLELPVIQSIDGELITKRIQATLAVKNGVIQPDVAQDILKIVVVNRYNNTPIAQAFIQNFNLKKGAIASSVAHDSHNIVAVGVDDLSLMYAINEVIRNEGGISVYDGHQATTLPLPIAGLMSDKDIIETAYWYELLDKKAKSLGSQLHAPFMTLSFMALPVIPSLKMTDLGLFDVDTFSFVAQ